MEIYLVQHAKSKSKEDDPERPLTDEGFQDIEKMANFAKKGSGIVLRKILHSGKLRARQTAEVLATSLSPEEGVEEVDNLDPLADPGIWAERISKSDGGIMLVGHLPHLASLAAVLLCEDKGQAPINFHNAGIIKLIRDPATNWYIDWIVVPSIIGS